MAQMAKFTLCRCSLCDLLLVRDHNILFTKCRGVSWRGRVLVGLTAWQKLRGRTSCLHTYVRRLFPDIPVYIVNYVGCWCTILCVGYYGAAVRINPHYALIYVAEGGVRQYRKPLNNPFHRVICH